MAQGMDPQFTPKGSCALALITMTDKKENAHVLQRQREGTGSTWDEELWTVGPYEVRAHPQLIRRAVKKLLWSPGPPRLRPDLQETLRPKTVSQGTI